MATRPEPTIIGNCDSWNFIVGKKPAEKSPPDCISGELSRCNMNFMHSLFTIGTTTTLDNLWVSCGSAVHGTLASRIVNPTPFNIPLRFEQVPVFYRNRSIERNRCKRKLTLKRHKDLGHLCKKIVRPPQKARRRRGNDARHHPFTRPRTALSGQDGSVRIAPIHRGGTAH